MARARLFVDVGNNMQYTGLHLGHAIIHNHEGEWYRSVSTYTEHLQNISLRQKKNILQDNMVWSYLWFLLTHQTINIWIIEQICQKTSSDVCKGGTPRWWQRPALQRTVQMGLRQGERPLFKIFAKINCYTAKLKIKSLEMLALKMSTCPPKCPSALGGWLFQEEEGHSTDIYWVSATGRGTVLLDSGESSKYLTSGDFPGGSMVPFQCRGHGFNP